MQFYVRNLIHKSKSLWTGTSLHASIYKQKPGLSSDNPLTVKSISCINVFIVSLIFNNLLSQILKVIPQSLINITFQKCNL